MDNNIFLVPQPQEMGRLLIRFEWHTEKDEEASIKEGRPIHNELLIGILITPGSNRSEASHRILCRKHSGETVKYEAYNRVGIAEITERFIGNDRGRQAITGTPLQEWPSLSRRQVADFEAVNVFTVEDLAGLDENAIARFGFGTRALVEKAKTYIAHASGNAPLEKLAEENAKLKSDLAEMQKQIAELLRASNKEALGNVA